jgi:hypothetical protein
VIATDGYEGTYERVCGSGDVIELVDFFDSYSII